MNQRQNFGAPYVGTPAQAPNAALLIDFDNVTVGIRSDLGKELKALLNSDIIRGKVAVQRAYADWRRYPQYIVPLAESSIDLIFAPAYGTSKKNATDLRMAVDAMEMVFTRPEIGTYILLTGDSDFSSCVLKLKEYGKYVIGVGMRESSSDLLIQNCDEYYSYHSLSGLTRTTVGGDGAREDPWTLVREAVREMVSSGDAMRPDRLKQVMLSLDPAFDEKKLGYSKFSRFVNEAAKKGLIGLKRGENGQHEILPAGAEEEKPAPREPRAEERRDRDRDRRGRNGRRGRERERRPEPQAEKPAPEEVVSTPAPTTDEAPEVVGVLEQVKGPEATLEVTDLQGAYGLLQHAVRSLAGKGGAVRDGEVKRKMLELAPDFDEGKLGFSKFSRFLRQAHDAEAIDLHRVGENSYDVSLPASGKRLPTPALREGPAAPAPEAEAEAEAEAPARGIRGGRRGRRGAEPEGPPPVLPEQVVAAPATPAEAPAAEAPAPTEAPAPAAEPLGVEAEAAAAPPAGRVGVRGRRGSRGRTAAPEGPPPVIPGQVIPSPRREEPAPAPAEAPAAEAPAPAEEAAPAEEPKKQRTRTRKKAEAPAPKPAPEPEAPAFSADALGLPTDRQAIENYLTNSYKGVGKKTAEQLTEAFGEEVFRVMQEEPDRVREVMGARRADNLLELWAADRDRRAEQAAEEAELPVPAEETPQAVAEEAAPEAEAAEPKRTRTRGRRGGRGRSRKAAEAEAPAAEPEAAPAEEPKKRRTRTRKKAEAAAPEAAPEPQGEGEGAKPASRTRGRRGGRGRTKKKETAGS